MQFSVSIRRTKLGWRFRKRNSWRNSKIRYDVSGYPNYERVWFLGLDVTIQWGTKLTVVPGGDDVAIHPGLLSTLRRGGAPTEFGGRPP